MLTSRSGRTSLERKGDVMALRILGYLESREDLTLQLVAADASNVDIMTTALAPMKASIGGCMLLAVVMTDRTFLAQTEEGYRDAFSAKKTAFEILDSILDIASLDFMIAFSSIATFGNAGQTAYSRYSCTFTS